jgi:hypothetical protein
VREARPTHPPLERRIAAITARLDRPAEPVRSAVPVQGTGRARSASSRTLLP